MIRWCLIALVNPRDHQIKTFRGHRALPESSICLSTRERVVPGIFGKSLFHAVPRPRLLIVSCLIVKPHSLIEGFHVTVNTTFRKRALAIATAVALGLTVFVAGPQSAVATVTTYPVPEGVYIQSPWAAPGDSVWVRFVGSTSECGDGYNDVTFSWSFIGIGGTTALSTDSFGEGPWGIARRVAIPANIAQSAGNLVLVCTLGGSGASAPITMPLLISTTAPASNYHSPTAWTFLPDVPTAGQTVTINALGFEAGESVTVTLVNQTMGNANDEFTGAFAPPATVTADGEGAVTASIVFPSGWAPDDVLSIGAAGASSHYLLNPYQGDPTPGDPSIQLISSTGAAFPGSALSVSASGYQAGETVSIGLHSATTRAVELATFSANSSGEISGIAYLPESVAQGSYRVWAGAKAIGYLLLNAPLTIGAKPSAERVSGENRFATAAAISGLTAPFATGEGIVYVASGLTFPDALSAGALAAQVNAPVLLSDVDALPSEVSDELNRLHPNTVKVVGGAGAISDSVFNAIRDLGFTHVTERVWGNDRFATNRELIRDAISGATVSTVYIATGLNFPDALAAAPAAASVAGVVLLVNGDAASLDSDTLSLLNDLGPDDIVLVGGTGVVSTQIESQLEALFPAHVSRYAGNDRFDTASKIIAGTWSGVAIHVILASGMNFPDALAASALGLPMLTSDTNCIPGTILAVLGNLQPDTVTIVGGTGALSDGVQQFVHC